MIRLLSGNVAAVGLGNVTIAVHGVGYLVATLKKLLLLPGDQITLHTYLVVRETALDLYGFTSEAELMMFELLLTIPKIGPKSALQILDQADITLIVESISIQDAVHLSKLSGIGKKTAEKIILELKDKITNFEHSNSTPVTTVAYQDAFDTLITLGYNPVNIKQVLDALPENSTTSSYVKSALQSLS